MSTGPRYLFNASAPIQTIDYSIVTRCAAILCEHDEKPCGVCWGTCRDMVMELARKPGFEHLLVTVSR